MESGTAGTRGEEEEEEEEMKSAMVVSKIEYQHMQIHHDCEVIFGTGKKAAGLCDIIIMSQKLPKKMMKGD